MLSGEQLVLMTATVGIRIDWASETVALSRLASITKTASGSRDIPLMPARSLLMALNFFLNLARWFFVIPSKRCSVTIASTSFNRPRDFLVSFTFVRSPRDHRSLTYNIPHRLAFLLIGP